MHIKEGRGRERSLCTTPRIWTRTRTIHPQWRWCPVLESRSFRFGPALGPWSLSSSSPSSSSSSSGVEAGAEGRNFGGGHRHTLNHQEGNFYNFSLVCFEFTFYFLFSLQLCFFSSFPWLDSSLRSGLVYWRVDAVFFFLYPPAPISLACFFSNISCQPAETDRDEWTGSEREGQRRFPYVLCIGFCWRPLTPTIECKMALSWLYWFLIYCRFALFMPGLRAHCTGPTRRLMSGQWLVIAESTVRY